MKNFTEAPILLYFDQEYQIPIETNAWNMLLVRS